MKHRKEKEPYSLWMRLLKVWGAFLGFLWSLTRIFIKSPSGRKRFNVLAALNAITHELVMVTNDEYINALSVCELLNFHSST